MNELDDFAWLTLRLGVFVIAQADFEVVRLADVKDAIARAGEQINAGLLWNVLEKIGSKALQQRLGKPKKAKLPHARPESGIRKPM